MKRLSVIIPGYNTPKAWWMRCIGSVRAAIGSDDEIIIVDDGSRDDFAVDAGWWSDKRINVIRKENGGLASARNAALDVASGRFVTFVDSDDEVVQGVYDGAIKALEKNHCDVCLFGVRVVWSDLGLEKTDVRPSANYGELTPDNVKELYDGCLFNYACNKVYDYGAIKTKLKDWGFRFDLPGMPYEDVIFNLNCVMQRLNWCNIDFVGYVYYRTDGTLLSNYKPSNHAGAILSAKTWAKYCDGNPESRKLFSAKTQISERALLLSDWYNIWRNGSPYGLLDRYKWLKENIAKLGGHSVLSEFIKQAARDMIRKHLYFKCLRRYNVRRLFDVKAVENG